jgi:hypothetical protein
MANRPNQRVSIPAARRHRFNSIGLKSPVKDTNSVAMPWVDMTEDVRLIREGHGTRLPNDRWSSINGRTYVRESGAKSAMYPEFGDGIVVLTREQYRALTILRGYTSPTVAEFRLQKEKSISDADIQVARDVIRQATEEEP